MPPAALPDQSLSSKEQALFRQLVKQYEVCSFCMPRSLHIIVYELICNGNSLILMENDVGVLFDMASCCG
jgi:hypothetical protein